MYYAMYEIMYYDYSKGAILYAEMNCHENHDKTDIFLMFRNKLCFF